MIGTACCLQLLRLLDIADTGGDNRINDMEWKKNLPKINAALQAMSDSAPELTEGHFSKIKKDGASEGNLLIKEVIDYFLKFVCKDEKLIAECEREQ